MRLNVSKVLRQEREEKARVKPLPVVRIGGKPVIGNRLPVISKPVKEQPPTTNQQLPTNNDVLLDQLTIEMGQLKRERGQLSTRAAYLVEEIEARLRAQSPAIAEEFMKGNVPMPELAEMYSQIEALTDKMAIVWDNQRYVQQHGVLPMVVEKKVELRIESNAEVDAITHEIRRLDDLIHKCVSKLEKNNQGIKAPKNTGKVGEWREKIALAIARRDSLKYQRKQKQDAERAKRIGEA